MQARHSIHYLINKEQRKAVIRFARLRDIPVESAAITPAISPAVSAVKAEKLQLKILPVQRQQDLLTITASAVVLAHPAQLQKSMQC